MTKLMTEQHCTALRSARSDLCIAQISQPQIPRVLECTPRNWIESRRNETRRGESVQCGDEFMASVEANTTMLQTMLIPTINNLCASPYKTAIAEAKTASAHCTVHCRVLYRRASFLESSDPIGKQKYSGLKIGTATA